MATRFTSSRRTAIQPRIGVAWDLAGDGDTILRSAFGVYYDQPLVGIFEQNSFTMPPIVNNVTFNNPTLQNPAAGQTPTTTGVRTIIATATDFENPRTMQWNVGVTQRFANWLIGEVSYVGSRGDNLIRPTDINYPDPARRRGAADDGARRRQPGAAVPVVRRDHVSARPRRGRAITAC